MKTISKIIIMLIFLFGCGTKTNYIPETLYGLSLKNKLVGNDAREFVNRLHYQKVTDTENIIGFYEGKHGKAAVYLTIYPDIDSAQLDEKKMAEKISPANSVFSPVMYKWVEGKSVGYMYGMGQTHYIFSHENKLFWISAENNWAEDFLIDYFIQTLKL